MGLKDARSNCCRGAASVVRALMLLIADRSFGRRQAVQFFCKDTHRRGARPLPSNVSPRCCAPMRSSWYRAMSPATVHDENRPGLAATVRRGCRNCGMSSERDGIVARTGKLAFGIVQQRTEGRFAVQAGLSVQQRFSSGSGSFYPESTDPRCTTGGSFPARRSISLITPTHASSTLSGCTGFWQILAGSRRRRSKSTGIWDGRSGTCEIRCAIGEGTNQSWDTCKKVLVTARWAYRVASHRSHLSAPEPMSRLALYNSSTARLAPPPVDCRDHIRKRPD